MAGIKVDAQRIADYAKTAADSSGSLAQQQRQLTAGHLPAAVFGELGKQVHTAEAYARASATLLDQLGKAAGALTSVAGQLRKVADDHTENEAESAAHIKRSLRSEQ